MTPDQITQLFTRPDGTFLCARWGRPIVPVVFGIDEASLQLLKGAFEAMTVLTRHPMAETDAELGANLMVFFFKDWAELPEVPHLEKLIPGLGPLCDRLAAGGANQYRAFRFDEQGAIRAVFSFLRMDEHLAQMPAADLALVQAAEAMLTWGQGAFTTLPPLARTGTGEVCLRPDLAELIRIAYDPLLPSAARDASHALRLYARLSQSAAAAGTATGAQV